ncbi:MAG TPA: hypothetical protein VH969_24130, partial [Actinophytocola sp.]
MSRTRRWLVTIAGVALVAGLAGPPAAAAAPLDTGSAGAATGQASEGAADEPIQDPLPDPVQSGLGITVEEFAQFPKTEPVP